MALECLTASALTTSAFPAKWKADFSCCAKLTRSGHQEQGRTVDDDVPSTDDAVVDAHLLQSAAVLHVVEQS